MWSVSRLWVAIPLALAVAGCGRPQPATPAEIAERAARDASEDQDHDYLGPLRLTQGQRVRLQRLERRVEGAFEPVVEEGQAYGFALADQVEQGQVDRAALEPYCDRTVSAFRAALPGVLDALNELHALLDPVQRGVLVSLLEQAEEEPATKAERRQARDEGVARTLDLGADQRVAIVVAALPTALRAHGSMKRLRRGMQGATTAFLSEQFDAHELDVFRELPFEEWVDLTYDLLDAVLPVLQPQQHSAAAALLRSAVE